MNIDSISYTFPEDCPVAQLRGAIVKGGRFRQQRNGWIVVFATVIAGRQVVATVAGKPDLERILAAHLAEQAAQAAPQAAAREAAQESRDATLEGRRERLAADEYNTYSPNHFPGSAEWMRNKRAADALREFDAAHPEIIAAINSAREEKRKADYDALSDFVKCGS